MLGNKQLRLSLQVPKTLFFRSKTYKPYCLIEEYKALDIWKALKEAGFTAWDAEDAEGNTILHCAGRVLSFSFPSSPQIDTLTSFLIFYSKEKQQGLLHLFTPS